MTASPDVLLLHTVESSPWANQPELQSEIEAAIPDIDLRVARTPPESERMIESADIVIASFFPSELFEAARNLQWIQALSSGVDFYDFETLRDRNIALTNVAGIHAEPIAEQVLGYMLTFERKIHTGIRQQERNVWERYQAGEIRGKTLGIIGLGAIGSQIATYANAFGMNVIGTKRDPETAPDVVDEAYSPSGLFDVLSRSDYVVLACPLTDDTRGLIGNKELGAMPSESVLINIARGEVVDEEALLYALQQGIIGGAALDVFEEEPYATDSPLWDLSNVIMTPHMAGSTPHKSKRVAALFAEHYKAYLDGGPEVLPTRIV